MRSTSDARRTAAERHDHLTFRGNVGQTRHGWLRLTPAYSVHLVGRILDDCDVHGGTVLDPFCGTGTTALVCAERGIAADTTDINPFLVWLAGVKSRAYDAPVVAAFEKAAARVERSLRTVSRSVAWVPPIHQIEKWWSGPTLDALARGAATIQALGADVAREVTDLLKVTFCRTVIDRANVSFGHQSMSFKRGAGAGSAPDQDDALRNVVEAWKWAVGMIAASARCPILAEPRAIGCDARNLREALQPDTYDRVITSPPYPNRVSYVRELRPYMYWLGYLRDRQDAGELDWQAIGGTWGSATSRVGQWTPATVRPIPYADFDDILNRVAETSPVLSKYIHKYFYDMARHCESLHAVVKPGASIHYIVGNSKFYDVLVPVERIFAALFRASGFDEIVVEPIRKRTSKRELFEFIVSARKPPRVVSARKPPRSRQPKRGRARSLRSPLG